MTFHTETSLLTFSDKSRNTESWLAGNEERRTQHRTTALQIFPHAQIPCLTSNRKSLILCWKVSVWGTLLGSKRYNTLSGHQKLLLWKRKPRVYQGFLTSSHYYCHRERGWGQLSWGCGQKERHRVFSIGVRGAGAAQTRRQHLRNLGTGPLLWHLCFLFPTIHQVTFWSWFSFSSRLCSWKDGSH